MASDDLLESGVELAVERTRRSPPYLVVPFRDILFGFSYIQSIPKQSLITFPDVVKRI